MNFLNNLNTSLESSIKAKSCLPKQVSKIKEIVKEIYVPGKLVNLAVKG